jgi:hypothetical protein
MTSDTYIYLRIGEQLRSTLNNGARRVNTTKHTLFATPPPHGSYVHVEPRSDLMVM